MIDKRNYCLNRLVALNSFKALYSICCALAIGLFFIHHSYTTFFIKMDYGYNMLINIALGMQDVKLYNEPLLIIRNKINKKSLIDRCR